MIYCDTSVLVTALTREADTDAAQTWLSKQEPGNLCVSGWTVAEFSCALSRKVRRNDLTPEERARVLTDWRLMLSENLVLTPVSPDAFNTAAGYADRHDLPLRASDALHVAIAALGGHHLATLDNLMAEASLAIGVSVAEIG